MSDSKDVIEGIDAEADGVVEAEAPQDVPADSAEPVEVDQEPEVTDEPAEAEIADEQAVAEAEAPAGEEAPLEAEAVEAEAETAAEAQPEPSDEEAAEEAPVETKPAPKPSSGIGDLLAVGILSLIMGALMVYITAVVMPSGSAGEAHDLSGGVAATVNGVAIGENEITKIVDQTRKQQGFTDDDSWGNVLVANQMTPESFREMVVEQAVRNELIHQAIKENGIEVPSDQVDTALAQAIEQQGGEEAFNQILQEMGMTMDEVRSNLEVSLAQQLLAAKIAGDVEPTDEEVLDMLKMNGVVEEDATSLEGVDEGMVQTFRDYAKNQKLSQAYGEWMNDFEDKADVKVEPMPEGLPYDIDLAPYQAAANEAAQDGAMAEDAAADAQPVGEPSADAQPAEEPSAESADQADEEGGEDK